MKFKKFISLKTKITSIILIITIFSIICTFVFVIINDLKRFKNELIRNAELISKIIGDYSIYDLTFKLKKESENKLKLLGVIPSVEEAILYNSNKEIFTSFPKKIKKSQFEQIEKKKLYF